MCADDTIAADDVADHLHALVDKSLVVAVPVGGGLRFTQLQTLAQYGRERLTERGDAVRIRDAMAEHFAQLCSQSAAAFTGDQQRAWLTAMDRDHDNLRAALDWAVANDDAETALMIAGGAAWPHWLTGMVVEGRRWLDDAFACAGRGRRAHAGVGADGSRPPRLPRRRRSSTATTTWPPRSRSSSATTTSSRWRWRTRSTPSRPPCAATSTRLAAADWSCSTSTESRPTTRSRWRPVSYSLAKLAILDGDLDAAERHYRAATEGFGRLDRPVMNSMCLGMVADFDERAGDYPAAIKTLEAAIATNESLLGGFTGSLQARLGWVLLHDGQLARAEAVYRARARLGPPSPPHDGDVPGAGRAGGPPSAPRT